MLHAVKRPAVPTDPVVPDPVIPLTLGANANYPVGTEWWCHVVPATTQVNDQLSPFILNLSTLKVQKRALFLLAITATTQGSDFNQAHISIRQENVGPVLDSEVWGAGTGKTNDTLMMTDVFTELGKHRYSIWTASAGGYYPRIRYLLRLIRSK